MPQFHIYKMGLIRKAICCDDWTCWCMQNVYSGAWHITDEQICVSYYYWREFQKSGNQVLLGQSRWSFISYTFERALAFNKLSYSSSS